MDQSYSSRASKMFSKVFASLKERVELAFWEDAGTSEL